MILPGDFDLKSNFTNCRARHSGREERRDNRSPTSAENDRMDQAIRLFQEAAQSAMRGFRAGWDEKRPGSNAEWWQNLSQVSGLPTDLGMQINQHRTGGGIPIFRFDPSPDALNELKVTIIELGRVTSEGDRIVLAILRDVEARLNQSGLRGAYTSTVARSPQSDDE